ncbi:MAG: hypothetical protein ACKV2Q_08590 [Planctomycetaceae bacterium]
MEPEVGHVIRLRQIAWEAWHQTSESQEGERAVLHNLVYDHRISDSRAKKVLDVLKKPVGTGDVQQLLNALNSYLEQHVRGRFDSKLSVKSDAFDRELNELNCIDLKNFNDRLNRPRLVRIQNLSNPKLKDPLYRASASLGRMALANGHRINWDSLSPRENQPFGEWIMKEFAPKTLSDDEGVRHRTLVAAELIRVLNKDRKEFPFEPAWTTLWDDLTQVHQGERKLLERAADDWANTVGVPVKKGDWIVLLQYGLDDADQQPNFARPSQLDAGSHYLFFPSPAEEADDGGHPMSLVPTSGSPTTMPSPTQNLLREYLHSSVDHTEEHIVAVKQVEVGTDTKDLKEWRSSHHIRLIDQYPTVPPSWMKNPNTLA